MAQKNQEPNPKDVDDLAGSSGSGDDSRSQPGEPSELDALVEAVIARVEPRLQEMSKKFFQSQKDKGVGKAVDTATEALTRIDAIEGPVKKVLHLMKERGLTEAEALDEVDRDLRLERLEQQLGQDSQVEKPATNETPPEQGDFDWRGERERILQDSGISKDSPAYQAFIRSRKWDLNNPREFVDALDAWAFQREFSTPTATGASAANTSKAVGDTKKKEPDLRDAYEQEMKELRETDPGNTLAIAQVRKKYRDQGLDI